MLYQCAMEDTYMAAWNFAYYLNMYLVEYHENLEYDQKCNI
jgi:hypothetical protein